MEPSPNSAFIVYKRKRKSLSPEADGDDRLEEKVEVDERGTEQHGGAPTSDAKIGTTMAQETPKEVKDDDDDKRLVLREVLKKSVEEEADHDKQKQNNDEKPNEVKQVAPVCSPSGLAMKEKYAQLRKRQKGRLLLKDVGKEPVSSSRPVGPKQRSDNSEILKRKGSNAPSSSSMSLKGKGVVVPNAALPKVTENISGSGLLLQSSKSSLNKNNEKLTPLGRKPAGYLKRNTKPNDWSELELDALWVGVRRFGLANWERILAESRGFIFKNNRTAQELSSRWNIELLKIFPLPVPPPPTASSVFPPICGTSHHFASLRTPPHLQPNLMFQTLYHHQTSMKMMKAALQAPQPAKGNLFPTRPEFPRVKDDDKNVAGGRDQPNLKMDSSVKFPRIKDNKNVAAGDRDQPIAVDSDSDEQGSSEGSEKTLSA